MPNHLTSERFRSAVPPAMGGYAALARKYPDLIDFSIGDPDLRTDEGIIRAAFADALSGYTHYTDPKGMPELRGAIARAYTEDFSVPVSPQEVYVATSASHAMFLTLEAILNDGDEVILIAPYFPSYAQQVRLARGVPVECDTSFEEGFQVGAAQLERCAGERTRAIIVNTPCNPTGACLSRESLEQIADFARRRDLIVLADDIYTIFSYGEPFLPIASLEGMRERTVTLNSFSKNYLMTGWRIGAVIAPEEIVDAVSSINEGIVYSAPSISQRAALYALEHRSELCPPIAEEYRRRLSHAAARINAIPRLRVLTPPGGTFYLFVDVRETGCSSAQACERILREAHVLTIPGSAFGRCGEGFLRLACTMGNDRMDEAFDRIAAMPLFQP